MDEKCTQTTQTTQNTMESTQEHEYTDESNDDCSEYSLSQVSSTSSKRKSKQFPSIRPRGKYDSDSRHSLIQSAYDANFVDAQCKKANIEKRRKAKRTKVKKLNEDVATVQQKRQAAMLKSADDTVPPKKRQTLKKYEPVDTPGQTKLTTFVTPATQKHSSPNVSTPNVSTPSQVPPIQKLKGTPSTVETMESSVSYKSPEPFSNEAQPNVNVPVSVGESNEVASVSTVGTSQLLPSMLARCVGVCNGCMMQFHLCHEAK